MRPSTEDESRCTVNDFLQINPADVVPMHCTGEVFIAETLRRTPEKVIRPEQCGPSLHHSPYRRAVSFGSTLRISAAPLKRSTQRFELQAHGTERELKLGVGIGVGTKAFFCDSAWYATNATPPTMIRPRVTVSRRV